MLAAGHTLERRYEVRELLGQGGMGCVYRVRHLHLERDFALKELTGRDAAAEAQFLEEARILAGLAHPHLPRVSDFFVAKGKHYLVMDFVPGQDLQARFELAPTPFGPAEVTAWLLQLLDALGYLHARGVVHRDIKPGNLKLTPEGRVMLVDFGIAKAGDALVPGRTGFYAKQAYTPYMAAPEQVMGQATGPRTDLYAAASTCAYLLTGQLPPSAAGLPAPLGPVLARAMAADPGGRWADAGAMRAALVGVGLAGAAGGGAFHGLAGGGAPHGLAPGGGLPPAGRRDIRRPG